jgi:hypothetical protein
MKRTLDDKIAEIERRSPKDFYAFGVLADFVLGQLDEESPERKESILLGFEPTRTRKGDL